MEGRGQRAKDKEGEAGARKATLPWWRRRRGLGSAGSPDVLGTRSGQQKPSRRQVSIRSAVPAVRPWATASSVPPGWRQGLHWGRGAPQIAAVVPSMRDTAYPHVHHQHV